MKAVILTPFLLRADYVFLDQGHRFGSRYPILLADGRTKFRKMGFALRQELRNRSLLEA